MNTSKNILKILGLSVFVVVLLFFGNKDTYSEEIIIQRKPTHKIFDFVKKEPVTILSFGDLMLGRSVAKVMDRTGESPLKIILQQEKELFEKTDLVTANLEGPITGNENCQDKPYTFKFKPEVAELLKEAGFVLFNLANNHAYDCYGGGLNDTRWFLDLAGMGYFGGNNLGDSYLVEEINGKKIAFVGIDLTIPVVPIDDFYTQVTELKKDNDYLIVNIHWGEEYNLENSENQADIGKKLIDNGVDIIFGHHPHVIQPVEVYKKGVIFYSLGNFVFDQYTENTTTGFGVKTTLEKKKIKFELYPYDIIHTQPRFMGEQEALNFCQNLLSKKVIEHKDCSFEVDL